jgi:hypothetical protein
MYNASGGTGLLFFPAEGTRPPACGAGAAAAPDGGGAGGRGAGAAAGLPVPAIINDFAAGAAYGG